LVEILCCAIYWIIFSSVTFFHIILLLLTYAIIWPLYGAREAQKVGTVEVIDVFFGKVVKHLVTWGKGKVFLYGDVLPERETVFVVMNHRWLADWMACFQVAIRKGRLGCVKLFAKKSVLYLQPFGLGLLAVGWPLLSRNWEEDQRTINNTFYNLKTRKLPFWLASHVEGTRITPEKLKQSHEYAKKNDLPILNNVLLPRKRGFVTTIKALRDNLDAIYDLTAVWGDGKTEPKFEDIVMRRGITLHIHVRRFPMNQIPIQDEELYNWLIERFKEKDQLIEHLKQFGEFPNKLNEPLRHLPLNIV